MRESTLYLFLLFHLPYPPSLLTPRDITQVRGGCGVDRVKSISGKEGSGGRKEHARKKESAGEGP